MLEDKDFELLENDAPVNENSIEEVEITKEDFELVKLDETVHEQRMQTKPTTFFKDSLKRFRKNKSSVVAAYILGGLLLMSFLVPIFDRSNTKKNFPEERYLAPKLFNAGTGFWDGTRKYSNMPVDISEMPDAQTEEEKQEHWWPSSTYSHNAIRNKKFTNEQYCNTASTLGSYGRGGYLQFGYYNTAEKDDVIEITSQPFDYLEIDDDLSLTVFDTYDLEKIHLNENNNELTLPTNYELGASALFFTHTIENEHGLKEPVSIQLVDYKIVHNIGSKIESKKEDPINIAKIITDAAGKNEFENAYFSIRMIADGTGRNMCSLVGGLAFESTSTAEGVSQKFADMSFLDATACVAINATRIKENPQETYKFWSIDGRTVVREIYLSKAYFCSFVYDTYEAVFGEKINKSFAITDLLTYEEKGWISFKSDFGYPTLYEYYDESKHKLYYRLDIIDFKCEILDPVHCPVVEPIKITDFFYTDNNNDGFSDDTPSVKVKYIYYKYLGKTSMPRYLMGTDKDGKDMFKFVFEGLRTSLLLGFLTFIVCFLFGLIWGSICGYFGGTVDLLMERFTDILSGIPWIVLMTLIIIHMGSNFWTFALALCMTGWIGTAARTRTQFYRFRGREYVLASRTLGASDARLITKHILPNALGTIITGAVLMIPSVIFSEATISYLGLGLKDQSSLGVILSNHQEEITSGNPYLLLFPAAIIALIMISFNLFGNGLRDAINPSLKGEEE